MNFLDEFYEKTNIGIDDVVGFICLFILIFLIWRKK
jgi:hypothetical protein